MTDGLPEPFEQDVGAPYNGGSEPMKKEHFSGGRRRRTRRGKSGRRKGNMRKKQSQRRQSQRRQSRRSRRH
jgi:hypothetical protein